jgi:hypothetical protein
MPLASQNLSKEKDMKKTFKKMAAALTLLLVGALLTAASMAQCPGVPNAKLHRQSWQPGSGSASLTLVSSSTDPIVGMWRVQFVSGGAAIDKTFVQWHDDGTELMNSSRNPDTQSFCMGVWQNTGGSTYELNHYGISWDPTISTTTPQGLANIRETVTLAADGNSYSGTFTLVQYDESGNVLATVAGTIIGYRVNVNTHIKVLF